MDSYSHLLEQRGVAVWACDGADGETSRGASFRKMPANEARRSRNEVVFTHPHESVALPTRTEATHGRILLLQGLVLFRQEVIRPVRRIGSLA